MANDKNGNAQKTAAAEAPAAVTQKAGDGPQLISASVRCVDKLDSIADVSEVLRKTGEYLATKGIESKVSDRIPRLDVNTPVSESLLESYVVDASKRIGRRLTVSLREFERPALSKEPADYVIRSCAIGSKMLSSVKDKMMVMEQVELALLSKDVDCTLNRSRDWKIDVNGPIKKSVLDAIIEAIVKDVGRQLRITAIEPETSAVSVMTPSKKPTLQELQNEVYLLAAHLQTANLELKEAHGMIDETLYELENQAIDAPRSPGILQHISAQVNGGSNGADPEKVRLQKELDQVKTDFGVLEDLAVQQGNAVAEQMKLLEEAKKRHEELEKERDFAREEAVRLKVVAPSAQAPVAETKPVSATKPEPHKVQMKLLVDALAAVGIPSQALAGLEGKFGEFVAALEIDPRVLGEIDAFEQLIAKDPVLKAKYADLKTRHPKVILDAIGNEGFNSVMANMMQGAHQGSCITERDELRKDIKAKKKQIDTLEAEVNKAEPRLAQMEAQLASAKSDRKTAEKERAEIERKYQEKATLTNALERELATAKDAYSKVAADAESAKAQSQKSDSEAADWKALLDESEKERNKLDAASKQLGAGKGSADLLTEIMKRSEAERKYTAKEQEVERVTKELAVVRAKYDGLLAKQGSAADTLELTRLKRDLEDITRRYDDERRTLESDKQRLMMEAARSRLNPQGELSIVKDALQVAQKEKKEVEATLERTRKEYDAKLAEANVRVAVIQKEFDDAKTVYQSNAAAQADKIASQEAIKAGDKELTVLKDRCDELARERERMGRSIKTLELTQQVSQDKLTGFYARQDADKKKLQEVTADFEKRVADKTALLEAAISDQAKLAAEKTALDGKLKGYTALERELFDARAQSGVLKGEAAILLAKVKDGEAKEGELTQKIAVSARTIADIGARLAASEKSATESRSALSANSVEYQKKEAELSTKIEASERTIASLAEKLSAAQRSAEESKAALECAQAAIREQNAKREAITAARSALMDVVKNLDALAADPSVPETKLDGVKDLDALTTESLAIPETRQPSPQESRPSKYSPEFQKKIDGKYLTREQAVEFLLEGAIASGYPGDAAKKAAESLIYKMPSTRVSDDSSVRRLSIPVYEIARLTAERSRYRFKTDSNGTVLSQEPLITYQEYRGALSPVALAQVDRLIRKGKFDYFTVEINGKTIEPTVNGSKLMREADAKEIS